EYGYLSIGMDHYALPHDELAIAVNKGTLHRNFMGYTIQKSTNMIGLGMSAISDAWFGFAQNSKQVESYISSIDRGEIPIYRGHILTANDLEIRTKILELMCQFQTTLPKNKNHRNQIVERLAPLEVDGIVEINKDQVKIQPGFRAFVRNVCMCFDGHLWNNPIKENTFSKTI
ncbi:MAG: hypothetical protein RLZZ382_824, partial [Bacteroidota bacterium]